MKNETEDAADQNVDDKGKAATGKENPKGCQVQEDAEMGEDMDAEATQPASGGGAALAQGHGRATLRRSSTKGIAEQMSASMGWLMEVLDGQRAKLAAQQEGLTGLQGELHAQEAALLNKHKQVRMLARASPPWVHG